MAYTPQPSTTRSKIIQTRSVVKGLVLQDASLLDESLHVVQPPNVFLLLLVVNIIGDEQGHTGVDAALFEVLLKQDLEVLVEVVERRAGVQGAPGPVLLRGRGIGEIGRREIPKVFDQEVAVLSGGIDGKSSLAGSLDTNVGMCGEALLLHILVVLVIELLTIGWSNAILGCDADVTVAGVALVDGTLCVCTARLAFANNVVDLVVVHGRVIEILVRNIVVEVGRAEGDADLLVAEGAGQGNLLVSGLVFNLVRLV